MAERRYIVTEIQGRPFAHRFDLSTVVDGRHGGFREFASLEAARAAVDEGKAFDLKHGHTSVVVERQPSPRLDRRLRLRRSAFRPGGLRGAARRGGVRDSSA